MDEIYTGPDQWKFENGGLCEYCRRQSYCNKSGKKGGCRFYRLRNEKARIKEQAEMALLTGLTPEQIGLTPEMIEYFNIDVPNIPRPGMPEAETFAPGGSEISEEVIVEE